VGGQFCPDGLECVDGFCVEPGGSETGDGDPGDGDPGDGDPGDGDPGDGDPGDGDPGDGDGDHGDGDGDPGDGDGEAQSCGNGVVDPGELCDDGNANDDVCTSACEWGPLTNIAFVTSELYTGNLGGVAGGDAKCQALAGAAGLPGTYMAWLGTWNPEVAPQTRFSKSPYPYVLVDGTKIADNWDDLVDGDGLDNPLNLDENGLPPPDSVGIWCFDLPVVWTGTDPEGGGGGGHCNHWTSSARWDSASVGRRTLATANWNYGCSGPDCDKLAPLYCFEQ
ncbi:MAG TPA: hypothetical protein VK034_01825, partial [Enhygromyxa sp.]|nr:hypothetical protein [Enhygromyxa sp.]